MINLTPHAITIRTKDGDVTFEPSGTVARVETRETTVGERFGVQVVRREFGDIFGLPENGEPCIVSSMVLAALPAGTPNVYAPDTGATAIRNDAGHIVAVTRLVTA